MLKRTNFVPLLLIAALMTGFTYSEVSRNTLNNKRELFKEELDEYFGVKETIEYGEELELDIPEHMELISHYDNEYLTPGTYKETIIVKAKEDDRISSFVIREVEVVDKTAPEIKGVKDLSTTVGEKIDLLSGVSSNDEVDGKLDVKVKGDYDFNKVGVYKLKAVSVDKSGNEAVKDFTLTVNEKPKPKPTQSYTQPQQPANQGGGATSNSAGSTAQPSAPVKKYSQIYFHRTGATVHFSSGGSSVAAVQNIIDSNPWTATVWNYVGGPATHSNTDGQGTYFVAHASHAFQSAMYMNIGEQVTVWDSTGHSKTYTVANRIVGGSYISDASAAFNSGSGEYIVFQTCLPQPGTNAFTILH